MAKSLQITSQISAQIAATVGSDVEVDNLTVFEATAVNTKPVRKRGSIFDKSQITRATLTEMVDAITPSGGIPLHTRHMQGEEMPVGRVFHAQVIDAPDGSSSLQTLFYLPNSEADLIAKLNTGTVDEVSIGLQAKHILCSECGWDYLGADSTPQNFWDRTCANDHVIGEDGVHVNLSGLDRWYELSLVSIGAAQNAKVRSRANALLASDRTVNQSRLAASGLNPEATICEANFREEDMNVQEFVATLSAKETELATLKASIATLEKTTTELKASDAKLKDQIAELSAKPDLSPQLEAATALLAELSAFVISEAKAALTAAGIKLEVTDATVAMTAIQTAKVHLHNTLPVGGRGVSADAVSNLPPTKNMAAFTTKR